MHRSVFLLGLSGGVCVDTAPVAARDVAPVVPRDAAPVVPCGPLWSPRDVALGPWVSVWTPRL